MSFSYDNNNTVEFLVPNDDVVIKMAVLQRDLAKIWFEDLNGQAIGRGQYQLRFNDAGGEDAPYIANTYIVDHRNNYRMTGPSNATIFTLSHQKQQSYFAPAAVDYVVRRPDGTIKRQRIGNDEQVLEEEAEPA